MSQTSEQQPYYPDDEIDLRKLFATLWRGKWIIIATTFIFAVGGVFYALSKPDIYQANVLLAPAQDDGGPNIGGQLGGLASLAGINVGGGGAKQTVMAKEVLRSRAFLTDFIHRYDLAVPLMAAKAWDVNSETWLIDREIYNPEDKEWLTDDDVESTMPTNWDMVKAFKEKMSLSDNKETGMINLSMKSKSPLVAKQWVEWLVQDINEYMREQDVEKAEARIAYLEEKLRETNIAGMQQVFYQLIESETRTVMLASGQKEYVFETVDPAVIPQERNEPKRALIALMATMLGAMLGAFMVFVVALIRSGKTLETNT